MKAQASIVTTADEQTSLSWLIARHPELAGRTVTWTRRISLSNGTTDWTFGFGGRS
jgi:2-oxo-4-hydroxy-4-carboxy--5-ureidoimidazoline (OHCU) decarboxylase